MHKKIILALLAFVFTSILRLSAQPAAVRISVFSLDAKILLEHKEKIKANNPLLLPAFKQLLGDAEKALAFGPVSVMEKTTKPPSGDLHDYMSLAPYFWPDPSKPNGTPYMRKDGETNPEVKEYKDKEHMPKLCEQVSTLALAYFFSDEEKYAAHALKLIRVWFLDKETRMNPNLKYAQAIKGTNDGRGAGLIDSRHLIKIVDAIGLLKGSKTFTAADLAGLEKWFGDFLNWMQTSKNGIDEMNAKNNHGVWYDAQRLSFALFTHQAELATNIVLNVQDRLDKQMDTDGNFPAELARTTSFHYSVFVMEPLLLIAQMAEHTQQDLWNYTSASGKSIQKGLTVLLPYLQQEKKWTGQQIKPFDFEEAIPLLAVGAAKYNCITCISSINNISAANAGKKRIRLLSNIYQ